MTLDIAMGGSTNTVLHLLAVAHEAGADFTMDDIDMLSRKTPCLCKVAPNTQKYHVQDVNRAGGIVAIMDELAKGGLVDTAVRRVDGMTLAEEIDRYCITGPNVCEEAVRKYSVPLPESLIWHSVRRILIIRNWTPTVPKVVSATCSMLTARTADWLY